VEVPLRSIESSGVARPLEQPVSRCNSTAYLDWAIFDGSRQGRHVTSNTQAKMVSRRIALIAVGVLLNFALSLAFLGFAFWLLCAVLVWAASPWLLAVLAI
jgi:hypothetical protein